METARPVHDSIVRGKEKLCSLLNGSRLSLLEIGQEELASASQKLVSFVRHFPIMAPDYTPMLTCVLKFADLLPIKDDSLSAALGHLANLAKIGYYPTDPAHVAYLSQALVFPENSKINLLDPCCGEGLALERIAQGRNCHTLAWNWMIPEHAKPVSTWNAWRWAAIFIPVSVIMRSNCFT